MPRRDTCLLVEAYGLDFGRHHRGTQNTNQERQRREGLLRLAARLTNVVVQAREVGKTCAFNADRFTLFVPVANVGLSTPASPVAEKDRYCPRPPVFLTYLIGTWPAFLQGLRASLWNHPHH